MICVKFDQKLKKNLKNLNFGLLRFFEAISSPDLLWWWSYETVGWKCSKSDVVSAPHRKSLYTLLKECLLSSFLLLIDKILWSLTSESTGYNCKVIVVRTKRIHIRSFALLMSFPNSFRTNTRLRRLVNTCFHPTILDDELPVLTSLLRHPP